MSENLDLPRGLSSNNNSNSIHIRENSNPGLPQNPTSVSISTNAHGASINMFIDPDTTSSYNLIFPGDSDPGFLKNDGDGNLIWENVVGSTINEVSVNDGSDTNPSYTFINDLTSGLYSSGASEIGLTLGGFRRHRIRRHGVEYLLLDYFDSIDSIKYQFLHYDDKLYLQTSNTTGNNDTFSSIVFGKWNNFSQPWLTIETANIEIGAVGYNTNLTIEQGRIRNSDGTSSVPSYGFKNNGNAGIYLNTGISVNTVYNSTIGLEVGDSNVNVLQPFTIDKTLVSGTPSVGTTGSSLFNVKVNEFKDTTTTASGVTTEHIFNRFARPTLSAQNANVTTTRTANLYIGGDPIAGTNQTLTKSWGLINEGKSLLRSDVQIEGDVDLSANMTMVGDLTLAGVTTITGNVNITGALTATTVNGGGGGGSQNGNLVSVTINGTSNYNIISTDDIILITDTGVGTKTITLPTLASAPQNKGRKIIIVKVGTAGIINILTSGGDTIDGPTFNVLELVDQYDRVHLFGDGVSLWYSI